MFVHFSWSFFVVCSNRTHVMFLLSSEETERLVPPALVPPRPCCHVASIDDDILEVLDHSVGSVTETETKWMIHRHYFTFGYMRHRIAIESVSTSWIFKWLRIYSYEPLPVYHIFVSVVFPLKRPPRRMKWLPFFGRKRDSFIYSNTSLDGFFFHLLAYWKLMK